MKYIFLLFLLFNFRLLFAQSPAWVNTIGTLSLDESYSMDKDANGNIYVCGRFSGTADFDPSIGVFNLTSSGLTDCFVAKYTQGGNLIWAFKIGSNDIDGAQEIKINNAGEVLVTGYFRGNVDFDPSASSSFMNGTGLSGTDPGYGGDIFLAKYANTGNLIWSFQVSGSYIQDKCEGIDIDDSDNIYLAGEANATSTTPIDADPGPGFYDIGGIGKGHGVLLKYSTNASFIWAINLGEFGLNSGVHKVKVVDGDTTLMITGFLSGTGDFDPGPGNFVLTSSGAEDLFVAKYSLNKTFIWAYSTGSSNSDVGLQLDIDANKDVYVTGWFSGTNVDFDPSPTSIYPMSAVGSSDSYVLKYSKDGNFIWAKPFGGIGTDIGWGLTLINNEVLLTGLFRNTVDFDPSLSTFNLTSNGGSDIYLSRFDTTGNFLCASQIGGIQNDKGAVVKSFTVDSFLFCGNFGTNNTDFDPGPSVLLKPNVADQDVCLGVYSLNSLNLTFNPILTGDTICPGQTPQLIINYGIGYPGPYDIVLSDGISNQSYTGINSGVPFVPNPIPSVTTTYTLISVNSSSQNCMIINIPTGISSTIYVDTSLTNISISASPSSVCPGDSTTLTASGAATLTWSGGISNGIPFTPSTTSTYTVTGTDAFGCSNSNTIQVIVNSLPNVIANSNPSSGNLCSGSNITLYGSGASSYTWSGGITNNVPFSPSAASTYTVTGVDANGCSNTSSISISILPNPTININATKTTLCLGESTTLTGVGGTTYTWSSGVINGTPFTPAATSTYTVIGTDANGCTGTSQITINVNQLPIVSASASPLNVCIGNPTTLIGNGASSYTWSGGISNGIAFTPSSTSTYTVTGTDANGCSNTTSVTVTVIGNLLINISPSDPILCIGDSIQLTATGAINYSWVPNSFINSASISNPLVYPSSNTTYTVTGSDANGCTGTSDILISVIPIPHLILSKSGDIECNQHSIQLSVSGASNYSWTPASLLSSPNSANTNANVNVPTVFTVTGTIGTCVVMDSIKIEMFNDDENSIFIPNAFSPNEDGINDCFSIIHHANFKTYYLTVYNRWGERVFETESPEVCWNGYFKSQPSETGVYYYYLKAETNCGKIFKKGDIMLIR